MNRLLEWFRDVGVGIIAAVNILFGAVFAPVGLLSCDWIMAAFGLAFLLFGFVACPWMRSVLEAASRPGRGKR